MAIVTNFIKLQNKPKKGVRSILSFRELDFGEEHVVTISLTMGLVRMMPLMGSIFTN